VVGEQVPKSIAIRSTEKWALLTARPLKFCHWVFWVPLKVLNGSANLTLRLLRQPPQTLDESHSERELRSILARSQSKGLMPFRRLLLIENVLDLGDLKVKDAMRSRMTARVLRTDAPWEENLKVIRESKLSRYPVLAPGKDVPIGIFHVKDLVLADGPPDLTKAVRPAMTTQDEAPLEGSLAEFQRRRAHLALVLDKQNAWVGIISLEDVLEEIVGKVEDEFESEPPVSLGDALTPGRVALGLEAPSIEAGIRATLERVKPGELPLPVATIAKVLVDRERNMSSYLERGIAIPHARLEGIDRPLLIVARSETGITLRNSTERAHLLFILITPAHTPRVHVRLLGRLGGILENSDFVNERLRGANSPAEVVEAIRAGEAASLG
jgi:tellurite resistance protein TerC